MRIDSDGTFTGTDDPDLLLGHGGPNFIRGFADRDVLIGDYGTPYSFNSDAFTNPPYTLDSFFTWRNDENPLLFDNGATPYISFVEISFANQYERYSLHLDAGQVLTVDVDYAGEEFSPADTVVDVTTPGGTVLATDDDSSISEGGLGSISTVDPFLQFTAPVSATYYIILHPFGGGAFATNNHYLLNISVSGHPLSSATPPSPGNDTLFGGLGNDQLGGGPGDDQLAGNEDNDWLVGGTGNDSLDGGAGTDRMEGGPGDDIYFVDVVDDLVTENAGEGTDIIVSSISYGLTANAENLTLIGGSVLDGTGNSLANVITGNDAANSLYGGAGNDTLIGNGGSDRLNGGSGADSMTGGTGDDRFYIDNSGDRARENASEGTDLVTSSITYTLGSYIENLTLSGTAAINGTGNSLENVIKGNGAANVLSGRGGNDSIDGGAGADTMYGGIGDDKFYVDDSGDKVIEKAGEGTDLVNASVTFSLGADIENLTLTGTAAIDGSGNSFDNIIKGNSADNTLNGRAGVDKMYGGGGNDIYLVDTTQDRVVEGVGAGIDTVRSSATFTLTSNVENLTLTGTGAINGTGNSLANELRGNDAANTLNGGAGDDKIYAHGGDDRIRGSAGTDETAGGTGADTFVFFDGDFGGTTTSTADEIVDFKQAEHDRIDLSAVDANTLVTGNQTFTFIGTNVFHGTPGELRYEQSSGNTYVSGDTNGDGIADFMIRIDGAFVLASGDIGL